MKNDKWIKIGNLEWLDHDLGEMNWNEAVKACEEAGGRLPTRLELIDLFDNHYDEMDKLIEDSPSSVFWSATEYSATLAWSVTLPTGYTNTNVGKSTNSTQVRCVR